MAHSPHILKVLDKAPIVAHAGAEVGQSESEEHWVHLPLAPQSDAVFSPAELGAGQSVDMVQTLPVPVGDAGSTGQLDDPHQFGQ